MKLVGLFAIGIIFMLAGFEGNLGSIIGAIIDPANMVEVGGNVSGPTFDNTPTSSLIGGTGPQYL